MRNNALFSLVSVCVIIMVAFIYEMALFYRVLIGILINWLFESVRSALRC